MRTIKYRFWEKASKKMMQWVTLKDHYQALIVGILDEPSEDWVPMQYTGLKDKNGKEIWESDTLLRPKGNLLKGEGWQEVKAPVRYVAEHGGFCWADWRLDKDMAATCEVVGNEYEGDIVKSPGYDNQMVVEYGDIQPSDDMTAPGIGFQFNAEPSSMEVIGNIYENPELLTPNN